MMRIFIVGLACFAALVGAAPCPTTSALETFLCGAHEEYHTLKLIGEVEILTRVPVPGMEKRAEEVKNRMKSLLIKAKNMVFFNTQAGEALNEFYIYWLTIIDDSYPRTHDDLASYQERSANYHVALQEKANRLKIIAE